MPYMSQGSSACLPGSEHTGRAPEASRTCSSGNLRLAGPGQEWWHWRELKWAKAGWLKCLWGEQEAQRRPRDGI